MRHHVQHIEFLHHIISGIHGNLDLDPPSPNSFCILS